MLSRIAVPVVILFAVGTASAQITVLGNLEPVGPGLTENPNCFGSAVLAYDSTTRDTLSLFAIFSFRRNTTYGIRLEGGTAGFCDSFAVTTNFFGFGFYQGPPLAGDATQNQVMTVYIHEEGDPLDCFDEGVTDSEIRAQTQ